MSEQHRDFGQYLDRQLTKIPFGSLGKRELELLLLKGMLDVGLCERDPVVVAHKFSLTLSKAHAYLTDLALREPVLSDQDAIRRLGDCLKSSEVNISADEILIPLPAADLRTWLERKLAQAKLIQGETLRRDLIRISPRALLNVLDFCEGHISPKEALKIVKRQMSDVSWISDADEQWKGQSKWRDVALPVTANVGSIIQAVVALQGVVGG